MGVPIGHKRGNQYKEKCLLGGFNSEVQFQCSCGFLQWVSKKHRVRCFIIERCSWAMVELVHGRLDIRVGYVPKTAAFGKVLPDQAVGVSVQAAFPGTARMGEIHVKLQAFLDGLMPGELLAVVPQGINRR
jgi:hypothetical protein